MEMSSIVVGDEEQEAARFNEDLKRFVQIVRTVTHAHICVKLYIVLFHANTYLCIFIRVCYLQVSLSCIAAVNN